MVIKESKILKEKYIDSDEGDLIHKEIKVVKSGQ